MNHFANQKIKIIIFLLIINFILSFATIYYENYWYIFIIILALSTFMNSIYAISLWLYILKKKEIKCIDNSKKNLAILVPVYNESEDEIMKTLNSIYNQKELSNNKILFIICDGNKKTSDVLLKMLNNNISEKHFLNRAYRSWNNKLENIEINLGFINRMNFCIITKEKNIGKRDTLCLIRRILFYYNNKTIQNNVYHNKINNLFSKEFINIIICFMNRCFINNEINLNILINQYDNIDIDIDKSIITINDNINDNINTNIDYIYGTDADTELDEYCIKNLLDDISNCDDNTIAIVGLVDVNISEIKFNLLKMIQYAEYMIAQCLRRNFQSNFTKKVNCLSGCNQLIKICKETSGEEIMEIFNMKPTPEQNIFHQVLKYSSEDRNHITLMFQLYPYIKTIQSLKSIAYTNVPLNLKIYLSQRKRWSLGSFTNDILLLFNINHNKLERFQSLINIIIYLITPFITVATIQFVINAIKIPNMLMLYLSIIMIIPFCYNLTIPYIKLDNINKKYYYMCYLLYLLFSPILSIITFLYTLINLDNFSWNIYNI
jgi:chitin synthase